jgi:hypothetical protein
MTKERMEQFLAMADERLAFRVARKMAHIYNASTVDEPAIRGFIMRVAAKFPSSIKAVISKR